MRNSANESAKATSTLPSHSASVRGVGTESSIEASTVSDRRASIWAHAPRCRPSKSNTTSYPARSSPRVIRNPAREALPSH
eukprot:2278023-Prymnesium_polylepis.1